MNKKLYFDKEISIIEHVSNMLDTQAFEFVLNSLKNSQKISIVGSSRKHNSIFLNHLINMLDSQKRILLIEKQPNLAIQQNVKRLNLYPNIEDNETLSAITNILTKNADCIALNNIKNDRVFDFLVNNSNSQIIATFSNITLNIKDLQSRNTPISDFLINSDIIIKIGNLYGSYIVENIIKVENDKFLSLIKYDAEQNRWTKVSIL